MKHPTYSSFVFNRLVSDWFHPEDTTKGSDSSLIKLQNNSLVLTYSSQDWHGEASCPFKNLALFFQGFASNRRHSIWIRSNLDSLSLSLEDERRLCCSSDSTVINSSVSVTHSFDLQMNRRLRCSIQFYFSFRKHVINRSQALRAFPTFISSVWLVHASKESEAT